MNDTQLCSLEKTVEIRFHDHLWEYEELDSPSIEQADESQARELGSGEQTVPGGTAANLCAVWSKEARQLACLEGFKNWRDLYQFAGVQLRSSKQRQSHDLLRTLHQRSGRPHSLAPMAERETRRWHANQLDFLLINSSSEVIKGGS